VLLVQGYLQSAGSPLILIAPESVGNVIQATLIGHSFVQADFRLNPLVEIATGKTSSQRASSLNQLLNPFLVPQIDTSMGSQVSPALWTATGATMTASGEPLLYRGHNIVAVLVAPGVLATMKPSVLADYAAAKQATFVVMVKANVSSSVLLTLMSTSGMVSS
jgi:hypothetical protein